MPTTGLTPEQRRLVEQAGERPVRIEDAESRQAYILVRADVYEKFRGVIERKLAEEVHVPDGIRRSQEAFFRDLPELLKERRSRGRYVAYHGNERVMISRSEIDVIRECVRRGLQSDQYDVFMIRPQSPLPEEVDYPSAWYDE
ncbi:MAG TPA: hypothetical protein VGY53_08625 [Isosphaeraceae bacterium]|jgi:hypothetical protein|nr:hypothetical protein [Isosphaeraceae bacterium]